MSYSLKVPYTRISYDIQYRDSYFLGEGVGRLLEGGVYYIFLALGGALIRRGRLFEAGS